MNMKNNGWIYFTVGLLAGWFLYSFANAYDADAEFSHNYELTMADTGLTLVSCKIIDAFPGGHKAWGMGPMFVLGADIMYRAGENQPRGWEELIHYDMPGIALGVLIEILFPPSKEVDGRPIGKPTIQRSRN